MSTREDPVLVSGRREAVLVALLWISSMFYTLGYCYRFGYERDVESLKFVLWFPDWVFWGVVAPWTVCTIVSTWFAFFVMRDEDLGADEDGEEDWNDG